MIHFSNFHMESSKKYSINTIEHSKTVWKYLNTDVYLHLWPL